MHGRGLVVGNWKMNGLVAFGQTLAEEVCAGVAERERAARLACDVVLCPPFTSLLAVGHSLRGSSIRLGGQNLSEQEKGSFTGEISAAMLRDVGCSHVIVGHSERRTLLGESDACIARKMVAALREGLRPIVCLGESLQERQAGHTLTVIQRQLSAILSPLPAEGEQRTNWTVAYEPVWAIGTGQHATNAQIQEVHAFIRGQLSDFLGAPIASRIQILYGGSVTPTHAATIFSLPDVDGGLIGGASLTAASFLAIMDAYPAPLSTAE
ncbi:MAG: triose-phosphate isomerase [Magnetococcus sp. MYC-9]